MLSSHTTQLLSSLIHFLLFHRSRDHETSAEGFPQREGVAVQSLATTPLRSCIASRYITTLPSRCEVGSSHHQQQKFSTSASPAVRNNHVSGNKYETTCPHYWGRLGRRRLGPGTSQGGGFIRLVRARQIWRLTVARLGCVTSRMVRQHRVPVDIVLRLADSCRIIEAFQQSLKTDLPDIRSVSTTLNLEVPSEGCIFDATNMQEFWRFGSQPGSEFIRADRAKLRAWLLTGVNVRWNKYFTHYHQDANGVTAFFSDGTSYTGDILVGADGVNSHVRSSLLPDPKFRPDYVPMGIIVGELIATEDQYRAWMNTAASFFIGLAGDRRIFVGLKAVAKNQKSAKYYWLFGWPDDDARKEGYWTVSASQEELHSYVLDHLDGVDSSFADILRATPVEGMLHPPLRMRDMTPPELPRGRVTMLGDAAHAMVPCKSFDSTRASTMTDC